MTTRPSPVSSVFRQELQNAAQAAGMTDAALPADLPPLGRRRRGGRPLVDERVKFLSLVSIDGVLDWQEGVQAETAIMRRGRRGRVAGVEVIEQFPFEKLERSDVTAFLSGLDLRLTPNQGFFHIGDLQTPAAAPPHGRVLVLIHGTFSDPARFVKGLEGPFLNAARAHYGPKNIFVFGHPTLAVGPLENALELAHTLKDSRAEIDVIAHSRGGLVARWWFEGVWRGSATPGRAVLVGSPLAGTSLAAPPRLRSTFKMLTNVANALGAVSGAASAVAPMLTLVTGLAKLVSSFTSIMSNTPITDALMAMVPGLVAQSRVGNQPGLLLLRKHFPLKNPPQYHIVSANFEPDDVPAWQFWKLFNNPMQRGLDFATDLIFDAPNDLVVDTASMSDFADGFPIAKSNVLELPTGPTIHHTNYFEQPSVIDFLSRKLLVKV
jgi:hypothetical protein